MLISWNSSPGLIQTLLYSTIKTAACVKIASNSEMKSKMIYLE